MFDNQDQRPDTDIPVAVCHQRPAGAHSPPTAQGQSSEVKGSLQGSLTCNINNNNVYCVPCSLFVNKHHRICDDEAPDDSYQEFQKNILKNKPQQKHL